MITAKGGTAAACKADVTKNAEIKAMVADAMSRWGKIDILHNNVGVSLSGGDAELLAITEEAFDRCVAINLKSCILAAKHVIPIMRRQGSGAIINISSMAAITTYPYVAYKATKSAMISFTEQLAYQNAEYGIRANVILPGLMNTPMAVDTRAREFKKSRAEVEAERDQQGAAAQEDGHRLGCRQRRFVSGIGRSRFHHWRDLAGRWRRQRAAGVAELVARMGGAKAQRYPSIAVHEVDGFREGLNPSELRSGSCASHRRARGANGDRSKRPDGSSRTRRIARTDRAPQPERRNNRNDSKDSKEERVPNKPRRRQSGHSAPVHQLAPSTQSPARRRPRQCPVVSQYSFHSSLLHQQGYVACRAQCCARSNELTIALELPFQLNRNGSKRSPDEQSRIRGFSFALIPHIAALMRTTCRKIQALRRQEKFSRGISVIPPVQLVARIMIRRHESRRWRVTPSANPLHQMRAPANFLNQINAIPPVQSPSAKIFRFSLPPNHIHNSRHPVPQRGVSRSSRTLVRDAMDARAAQDERRSRGRRSRVVLAPRRWR